MRSRHKIFFIGFVLISIFTMTSCTAGQIGVSTTPTSLTTNVVPKVSADAGALKVTLISSITGKPLSNALVRCANMLKMSGTIEGAYVPELNSSTSPWGNTDGNGTLIISNIKPGKYSLAYIFPPEMPELIKEEGKDVDLSFDIEAGKVLDLGTLKVTINPDQMH